MDARALEHGTHRATGDDTGTGGLAGLQQHDSQASVPAALQARVRDGAGDTRYPERVLILASSDTLGDAPRAPPWPCRTRRRPCVGVTHATTERGELNRRHP